GQQVESAGEVPEVLRKGVGAGDERVYEVQVARVLVRWVPIAALAEATKIGREHDVAQLGQTTGVVVLVAPRQSTHFVLPGPGPGATRSGGTRRYAGTDIAGSASNTTRVRRYDPAFSSSNASAFSGTASGDGPSASSSRDRKRRRQASSSGRPARTGQGSMRS